jgi:hypothetical protein
MSRVREAMSKGADASASFEKQLIDGLVHYDCGDRLVSGR